MKIYEPMLAKPKDEIFDDERWLFEPKYDGIRAIVYYDGTDYTIINRSLRNITHRFPELKFKFSSHRGVVDGEIVCLDENGIPDFQLMQTRMNRNTDIDYYAAKSPATFFAFDLLEYVGMPIIEDRLIFRKDQLIDALEQTDNVKITPFVIGQGTKTLSIYKDWEGVMAKKITSMYYPGSRSSEWLKVKPRKMKIVDVVGFIDGIGKRENTFGALVAVEETPTGKYKYLGNIGTGFTDSEIDKLLRLMQKRKRQGGPFPKHSGSLIYVNWCEPFKIVVSYIEITKDGQMRHPSYEGLVDESNL